MNLLLRMAPAALIMLIPVSRVLEPGGFAAVQGAVSGDPGTRLALLCNAVFAFLANALNFLITQRTSALTLQVRLENRQKSCVAPTIKLAQVSCGPVEA